MFKNIEYKKSNYYPHDKVLSKNSEIFNISLNKKLRNFVGVKSIKNPPSLYIKKSQDDAKETYIRLKILYFHINRIAAIFIQPYLYVSRIKIKLFGVKLRVRNITQNPYF